MARIRTLKPEITADEKLGRTSRDARLLFVFLITSADDGGRFRAAPAILRGLIFPYDDDLTNANVAAWLAELVGEGLVRVYEVHGETFGELVGWEKHQRVDNAGRMLFPAPGSTNGSTTSGDGEPVDLGGPPKNSEDFGGSPRDSASRRGVPRDSARTQDPGPRTQEGENTRGRAQRAGRSRARAPASGRGLRVCPHPEAFEQLWDGWPAAKRTRVEEARSAWADAAGDDPAAVLAAAATWQRWWAAEATPVKYIPRVGNWLRSGDWKLTPPSSGTDEQARLERKRQVIDDFVNGRDPP
ncbi:MAG TPA: hypothetical protein VD764_08950 [Nocardioides sp.]|nr:hypothetical protein [Nocardioides sp.]